MSTTTAAILIASTSRPCHPIAGGRNSMVQTRLLNISATALGVPLCLDGNASTGCHSHPRNIYIAATNTFQAGIARAMAKIILMPPPLREERYRQCTWLMTISLASVARFELDPPVAATPKGQEPSADPSSLRCLRSYIDWACSAASQYYHRLQIRAGTRRPCICRACL
jgi:hypothetical protein